MFTFSFNIKAGVDPFIENLFPALQKFLGVVTTSNNISDPDLLKMDKSNHCQKKKTENLTIKDLPPLFKDIEIEKINVPKLPSLALAVTFEADITLIQMLLSHDCRELKRPPIGMVWCGMDISRPFCTIYPFSQNLVENLECCLESMLYVNPFGTEDANACVPPGPEDSRKAHIIQYKYYAECLHNSGPSVLNPCVIWPCIKRKIWTTDSKWERSIVHLKKESNKSVFLLDEPGNTKKGWQTDVLHHAETPVGLSIPDSVVKKKKLLPYIQSKLERFNSSEVFSYSSSCVNFLRSYITTKCDI
ncbi:UNVERIFIED_CONTAM: hypothetical protein NCL1_06752 [Trichonephila clavipes]